MGQPGVRLEIIGANPNEARDYYAQCRSDRSLSFRGYVIGRMAAP